MSYAFEKEPEISVQENIADKIKREESRKLFSTGIDGEAGFKVNGQEKFYFIDKTGEPRAFFLKRVEQFDREIDKKEKLRFEWIFPLSLLLNFFVVLIAFFIGLPEIFIIPLLFSVVLLGIMFMAGENFFLWVLHAFQKNKNWGFKIKSLLDGRDLLLFGKMKEKEQFKYVDEAGQKRIAEVRTRKLNFFSNLRVPYAVYREGYSDTLDWHEEYPVSRINRDINQSIIAGPKAGALWMIDEYIGLLKSNKPNAIILILLAVAIGVSLIAAIMAFQNNPQAVAEVVISSLPESITGAGVENVIQVG